MRKVFVVGATGKMGQAILKVFPEFKDLEPWGFLSRKQDLMGSYKTRITSLKDEALAASNVWVDFSLPELFDAVLEAAVEHRKPLVSGVTGLNPEQKKEMEVAAREIPILWSSNMSLGIAVLKKALEVSSHLSGFDFQIEEFHHHQKRDNPSGTALSLQEKLNFCTQRTNPEPIGIRGGSIFGVHKVWMMGPGETLCFEHQALDREVFARGALSSANWIVGRAPGLYSIEDVLFSTV
jgi:4-hydroxy-tetrahydrodipicolinate reductase